MTQDTALALIQHEPFNKRQLDIITNQIAKGASEDELAFFLEVCRMTGLNPLQRQIYAIMRNAKEKDEDGNWRTAKHMTIQTGIDGYRLIAARTGQLAGIDDPTYDTETADNPNRASVTVWRFVGGQRVPFTATARWKEYVQEKDVYENNRKTDRKEPSGMWGKMPYLMLGKCAEALALRKAFPAELSGIYTGEEMQQADNDAPPAVYVESAPTPIRQPAKVQEQPRRRPGNWSACRVIGNQLGWSQDKYESEMYRLLGKKEATQYTPAEFTAWANYLQDKLDEKREAEGDLTPDPEQPHDLRALDASKAATA